MILAGIRSALIFLMAITALNTTTWAEGQTDLDELLQALRIGDTVEIMHQEGLSYGADLAVEMLPDVDGDRWRADVARIYDVEKMQLLVEQGFETALENTDLVAMLEFFKSDLGHEVVALELATRRAFLDTSIEDAARARFSTLAPGKAAFLKQIETIIDDSDLIEMNVMSSLNSNLMFYRGLSDGKVFDMAEADILAEVWGQEQHARLDTQEWLGAFFLMAYDPLEPEDLESYAAFYRTEAGKKLNIAMFSAFNQVYDEISYLLGLAVAQNLAGERL